MGYWHQKNELCYNSRLSEPEFEAVLALYCKGSTPRESAAELSALGLRISRQTIAAYFLRISGIVIEYRKTYPWWSQQWDDFTSDQFEGLRDVVHARGDSIGTLRHRIRSARGVDRSVDNLEYIRILRDMSKRMNGLPKEQFWVHLVRACEMALYIHLGYQRPSDFMLQDLRDLFRHERPMVWKRKTSKKVRSYDQRLRDYFSADPQSRSAPEDWVTSPEDHQTNRRIMWWRSLSEEQQKAINRKKFLRAFDPFIDLPREGG